MNTSVTQLEENFDLDIDRFTARITALSSEIDQLKTELCSIDADLDAIADERRQYEVLAGVCEGLETLDDIGARDLFWFGLAQGDRITTHITQVRDKVSFFESRIGKVTGRRDALAADISSKRDEISYLEQEIDNLRDQKEQAQHYYVIEREIRPLPYRVVVMPWTKNGEDERKFRKIMLIALLIGIILGGLIPLYKIPIPDRAEVVEIPERLAKLVKKEIPKPKPKPKQEQVEKQTEKKKEATKEERKVAKEKVKNKGVLAFKNNFADLLDDASLDDLGANANLSDAGSTARRTQRSILTSQVTSSSGGVRTSSLSRNVAGTGDRIEAVAFSRVDSAIGTAVAEDRPLSDGPGPSRTDEEIQIVFDKYKASLYRIYNRELRVNPTLQGKVVLRITIEPDGSVSLCKVESTDMDAKKLLVDIAARVKRFNFGAKEGVPATTILYPVDFLPSS